MERRCAQSSFRLMALTCFLLSCSPPDALWLWRVGSRAHVFHVRRMATVSQQSFVQGCNGMFESNAIADLPPPALVATFMRGVSQLLNALSLAAKLVTVKGSPSTYSRDFFSAWSSSVMSQVRELCFARTCLQQRWHGAHFVFHPQLVGQLREQTLPGAVYLRVKRQTWPTHRSNTTELNARAMCVACKQMHKRCMLALMTTKCCWGWPSLQTFARTERPSTVLLLDLLFVSSVSNYAILGPKCSKIANEQFLQSSLRGFPFFSFFLCTSVNFFDFFCSPRERTRIMGIFHQVLGR